MRIVCSGPAFREHERQNLQHLGILDKTINFYATDVQMAQLYHDAEMLVVPSYYEGFGMPILEAWVYNCPVVLSNASCLPEIAGDAGIYFDPYDAEEMSAKMSLMLDSPSRRKQQVELCQQRLADFSWEKCAGEHLAVYKSLI
ncbi:hypothetical protein FACS189456_6600 [Bacteroidia bacterium]|nr:hypothetical protein FACS189456_6600 [Bacteroidia bacterium]